MIHRGKVERGPRPAHARAHMPDWPGPFENVAFRAGDESCRETKYRAVVLPNADLVRVSCDRQAPFINGVPASRLLLVCTRAQNSF